MSDSREIETSESSENGSPSRTKYEMPPSLQEKLQDIPGALKYIKLLEKQLKKQRRKLRKIRTKYKLIPEVQDAQVQTDATYETSKEPKSIIEEIKEAAELATQNSGFVYDECSGMYYDANTGYYYNAVTQSFGVCYFY
jgi:hypothetical protein